MYRKIRDARYVNPSILPLVPQHRTRICAPKPRISQEAPRKVSPPVPVVKRWNDKAGVDERLELALFPATAFFARQSAIQQAFLWLTLRWDLILGTAVRVVTGLKTHCSCGLTRTCSSFVNTRRLGLVSRLSSPIVVTRWKTKDFGMAPKSLSNAVELGRVLVRAYRQCEGPMGQRPTSSDQNFPHLFRLAVSLCIPFVRSALMCAWLP